MGKESIVSVIVPVYNAEQYLQRCIDSILIQTYQNIELLLINDGSTDNSKKICIDYTNRDKRVKLININNSGPSIARNEGIDAASGNYIQFVDADDYIESNMTELLVNDMCIDVDIVFSGYKTVSKDSKGIESIRDNNRYKRACITRDTFLNQFGDFFKKYYINYLWNKLYKASIVKQHGIRFDSSINWGEDLLFNIEYLGYCDSISILNKSPYHHIAYNTNSVTSRFNKDLFIHQTAMYDSVKQFLTINNAYSDENKLIVETKVANAVVLCLDHLFHPDANYGKGQLRDEVIRITTNATVRECLPYMNTKLHRRIMRDLITLKSANLILLYLYGGKFWRKVMTSFSI